MARRDERAYPPAVREQEATKPGGDLLCCNHARVCQPAIEFPMQITTKLLLLGVGRWGSNHLRVLSSLPVELFVAEVDAKRLDSARELGVDTEHRSTHYKDFVATVDAAVVVT